MSCSSCAASSVSQAQQAAVSSQIQYAVQAKFLAAARQQGEAVSALLQGAVTLSKQSGSGENLDVQA